MKLNVYESAHKFFKTKKRGTQKLFHGHYLQDGHRYNEYWQLTIID